MPSKSAPTFQVEPKTITNQCWRICVGAKISLLVGFDLLGEWKLFSTTVQTVDQTGDPMNEV